MADCNLMFLFHLSLLVNVTPLSKATNNFPTYCETGIPLSHGRNEKPDMVSIVRFIFSWLHLSIHLHRSSMKTLGSSSQYTYDG
ncbi:hypothetical protein E4T38_05157 [Aureobasidium subglaciale]|nr:hypothetical protein E4T38_05157 [Aureobasidium subglaciale]KAI5222011.1 hypothetical protein E4T40_05195 [Aureobasidium subglaciale]KAI5225908.1 hypothetical protein E4T41_05014 [Aureobasidium subglaciale]KAI5261920.1 hypothetical protein E4T46_04907 [Aureobasidium subglaciale]